MFLYKSNIRCHFCITVSKMRFFMQKTRIFDTDMMNLRDFQFFPLTTYHLNSQSLNYFRDSYDKTFRKRPIFRKDIYFLIFFIIKKMPIRKRAIIKATVIKPRIPIILVLLIVLLLRCIFKVGHLYQKMKVFASNLSYLFFMVFYCKVDPTE